MSPRGSAVDTRCKMDRDILRRYKGTVALAVFLATLIFYRAVLYRFPAERNSRNPLDYAIDVAGFSYHFVLLAFDSSHSGLTSDYHARQALRYKPGDPYMGQFVPAGGR